MNAALRLYITVVALAGAFIVAVCLPSFPGAVATTPVRFASMAGLLLLAELRPIPIHRRREVFEIVGSTTFAYALVIGVGVAPAVVAHVVVSLFADRLTRKPLAKTVFNASQYALSAAVAGWAFAAVPGGHVPVAGRLAVGDLAPLVVGAVAYFLCNNVLVWAVVALANQRKLAHIVADDLVFNITTSGVLLALSPLVSSVASHDVLLTPFLLIPVYAVYQSARVSVEKEDLALHDSLTGLANRALFEDEVRRDLDKAGPGDVFAVGLMDLNGFKDVNDTLGHHIGDELLKAVGPRLHEIEGLDVLARFGGDEFTFLVKAPTRDDVCDVAERVVAAIAAPIVLDDDLRLEVSASLGIAFFPEHGTDVDGLLQRADVAMYLAKQARSGYEVYTSARDHNSRRRLALSADLRSAIAAEQLLVQYQPKLDLRTGLITGTEALVRWQHPDFGIVSPGEFIPLAEHTGAIVPLTTQVLETTIAQVRAWHRGGHPLRAAVNISARILQDETIVGIVLGLLERYDVEPACLDLEVTESCIMADARRAEHVLNALHREGLRISIDDFGTGYSSLSYLARLPVSEVKIDRSFVTNLEIDPHNSIIVRSTIELGRSLGLEVTAEGVESSAVRELLRELGCDYAQGYLIGRPAAPEDVAALAGRMAAEQPRPLHATVAARRIGPPDQDAVGS